MDAANHERNIALVAGDAHPRLAEAVARLVGIVQGLNAGRSTDLLV